MKSKTIIWQLFCFLIILSCFITITVYASSDKPPEGRKVVTSIYIQSGDTLWGIASRYYTDDYKSMRVYINEIKECNHLSSDKIHAGNYLIVPFYQ